MKKRGRPKFPVEAVTAAQGRAYVLAMLGKNVSEIAALEGITERAVYDRIAKGRGVISIDQDIVLGTQRLYKLIQKALGKLEEAMEDGTMSSKEKANISFGVLDRTIGVLRHRQRSYGGETESPEETNAENIRREAEASAARIMAHLEQEKKRIAEQEAEKANRVEAECEVVEEGCKSH